MGGGAVLLVDSIAARRLVWETARDRVAFFADGRMAGEVVRFVAAARPPSDDYYATTLFAPSVPLPARARRGARFTPPRSRRVSMVGQFARWLRDQPVERDLTLNLLASELTVAKRHPPRRSRSTPSLDRKEAPLRAALRCRARR